jgi:hypothetical protein
MWIIKNDFILKLININNPLWYPYFYCHALFRMALYKKSNLLGFFTLHFVGIWFGLLQPNILNILKLVYFPLVTLPHHLLHAFVLYNYMFWSYKTIIRFLVCVMHRSLHFACKYTLLSLIKIVIKFLLKFVSVLVVIENVFNKIIILFNIIFSFYMYMDVLTCNKSNWLNYFFLFGFLLIV